MIDLIKSSQFDFWVPMDLCKSATSADSKEPGKRWVEGIASTESLDLQKEVVNQTGIDASYFLEYGYFNNDHKPGFENKVGQPTEAKIQKEGFWTKGYLFDNHKTADAIWELAHALIASDSDRKLGFSIQGKVLRRAGNRILRCWVQDVAITAAPINTNTWLDVVKSLSAVPKEMWCEGEVGVIYPDDTQKAMPCAKSCGKKCSCMSASLSEEEMDIKKKTDEDEKEKAFSTGTAGGALVPESLDRDNKDQCHGGVSKALVYADCVSMLQNVRGFSRPEAIVLTDAVFEMNRAS